MGNEKMARIFRLWPEHATPLSISAYTGFPVGVVGDNIDRLTRSVYGNELSRLGASEFIGNLNW